MPVRRSNELHIDSECLICRDGASVAGQQTDAIAALVSNRISALVAKAQFPKVIIGQVGATGDHEQAILLDDVVMRLGFDADAGAAPRRIRPPQAAGRNRFGGGSIPPQA